MKRFIYGTRLMVAFCAFAFAAAAEAPTQAILFPELGRLHRAVTTNSVEAQEFFDQGLTFSYGFNHAEAIRSYRRAAELDPNCAMAWWGIALASGPNYNYPFVDEKVNQQAYEAIQKAASLTGSVTPVERDLIQAQSKRFAMPAPADRLPLDQAYAAAMREVYHTYPEDVDVGTLYIESMMNLRPWGLWTPSGQPQPGTLEIVSTLEKLMAIRPDHAGALHLYIHAMEASATPEKALEEANRLRFLVPGAGHLVHMPSHIYIRLGLYDEAIQANQRAIEADLRYVNQAGRQGFYDLYRAHNYHFVAYAAMFEGRQALALKAARDMAAELPLETIRQQPDFLESFLGILTHVRVRFGLWEELLAEPKPPADLPLLTAYWRYGRTVALSSLKRPDEAAREYDEFERAIAAVPDSRLVHINKARTVLEIGRNMARGEMEYRRGNVDQAFALLREAVRQDDALRYDEPWGWMQPVRHALGALLLEQGRVAEAEAVYRQDLRLHPNNGWALHGLAECLQKEGRTTELADVSARLEKAWALADITLRASCFCRQGSRGEDEAKPSSSAY